MQIKTKIAKTVEEVDTKIRYDAAVKKVLSNPQILSWILKYTVKELHRLLTTVLSEKLTPEVGVTLSEFEALCQKIHEEQTV